MNRIHIIAAALIAGVAGATPTWALAVLFWWMVPKRRKGW